MQGCDFVPLLLYLYIMMKDYIDIDKVTRLNKAERLCIYAHLHMDEISLDDLYLLSHPKTRTDSAKSICTMAQRWIKSDDVRQFITKVLRCEKNKDGEWVETWVPELGSVGYDVSKDALFVWSKDNCEEYGWSFDALKKGAENNKRISKGINNGY